jgi:hypothetical protein
MANANLKQNVDEVKVIINAWYFNFEGNAVMVMKIPEFDYWAGVDGNIYSLKGKQLRRLKARDNGIGYLKVSLSISSDKSISHYVHRLVADAWLEDGEIDYMENKRDEINHIDGDKSNNKLCNLERVSRQENVSHHNLVLKAEDYMSCRK